MNYLADSNILMYATQPENDWAKNFIIDSLPSISIISKIEVLGYHLLKKKEKTLLEEFISNLNIIWINEEIVKHSIFLRQKRRIRTADAIIAATAIVNKLTLVTKNHNDFKSISKLKLLNLSD